MPSPSDDPRARAAELRRQADRIEAEAERREALAATIRSLASRLASIGEDAATADAAEIRRQLAAFVGEAQRILEGEGLPLGIHRATIDAEMQATKDSTRDRPGHPLVNKGPLALAAKNAGLSMFELADKLGEKYSTVKTWNRRKTAPESMRSRLSRAPYLVPADAWN